MGEILRKDSKPQSLGFISQELDIPIRTLRRYAPDLCIEIAQKCVSYEANIATQHEKTINDIAYKTAFELMRKGIIPTSRNVGPYLPHQAYLLNSEVRNSIKKAINDFKQTSEN